MNTPPHKSPRRDRLAPLLRAIQREIYDRRQRVLVLIQRLEAFATTRRIHAEEIARLESDLSNQRRELRHVAKELARLGIEFDAEEPRTIIALRCAPARDERLEDSGFRRQLLDLRS